jgi:beta-1,4-mannosyl-glycoprotein beta-1,4-N-acetylglucosaminyltransferase
MIIDCVMLFDELDLLELRIRELSAAVDRFVVVEATVTHSGHAKPLAFAENAARFAEWADRIDHVVVEDLPKSGSWDRELHQRNAIMRALSERRDDDIILISDVDEIPNPTVIPPWLPDELVVVFDQTFSYYALNCQCLTERWCGTRAARLSTVRRLTPQGVRMVDPEQCTHPSFKQRNGGWHFSYLGGPAAISRKIGAFAHQEFNTSDFRDESQIAARIAAGVDLFGRPMVFETTPIDDSFPRTVRTDPERWRSFLMEPAPAKTASRRKISLVIAWTNRSELIESFEPVAAAADQTIVIDNRSDATTATNLEAMCRRHPNIQRFQNTHTGSLAADLNWGLAHASGEIVVFLADDVAGSPEAFDLLRKVVRKGTLYGAGIGTRTLFGVEFIHLDGACIAGTVEDFRSLGGFVEDFAGTDWNAIELSTRALRAGMGLMTLNLGLRRRSDRGTETTRSRGLEYEADRSRFVRDADSFISALAAERQATESKAVDRPNDMLSISPARSAVRLETDHGQSPRTVAKTSAKRLLDLVRAAESLISTIDFTAAIARHSIPPNYQRYMQCRRGGGEDYYKGLASLARILGVRRALDLGTNTGASAVALATEVASVDTFDITFDSVLSVEKLFASNIRGHLLQKPEAALDIDPRPYELVFVDIDHTGMWEREIHRSLTASFRGVAAFDDIFLNDGMRRFWENIEHPKVVTDWHFSGFGIVDYRGD